MGFKVNLRYWVVGSLAVFVIHSLFGFFVTRFVYPPSAIPIVSSSTVQDPVFSRLFIYFGRLVFSGGFVLVFLLLYKGKVTIRSGVQYGLLMAVLLDVPAFFADMVKTPWSASVISLLCIVGILEAIVLGVMLTVISRPVRSNPDEGSRQSLGTHEIAQTNP